MKVGDRVKVIALQAQDMKYTDLKVGDTGIVDKIYDGYESGIVSVDIDRLIQHDGHNWNATDGTYNFFKNQLEVIKDPDTITITRDEFMTAVARTMESGNTFKLIREWPIMRLLFATFGACLTATLFDKEGGE